MAKTTGDELAKWKKAAATAVKTDKWTETLFLALTNTVASRWKFHSFRGSGKRESAGAVDILAVRRNTSDPRMPPLKRNDLFEFILVQLKGGGAKMPTPSEKARLWAIREHYAAKEVVLFQWKLGKKTAYKVLRRTTEDKFDWELSNRDKIFGKSSRTKKHT